MAKDFSRRIHCFDYNNDDVSEHHGHVPALNIPGPALNSHVPALKIPGPALNSHVPALKIPGPHLIATAPHLVAGLVLGFGFGECGVVFEALEDLLLGFGVERVGYLWVGAA